MKWVSVKDRLPEINKDVLTFSICGIHTAYIRRYEDGDDYWMPSIITQESEPICNVTHWAELPQPPEGA